MPRLKKTPPPDAAPAAEAPVAETGERILGAAFAAFMEKGYGGTSTLEIATRAKVSKRDLYAAYASKQAVLIACIANRAARMELAPDLPVPRDRDMLAATLTRFGATIIREVSDPHVTAMFRLGIAEAERSPEIAAALNATRGANRDTLTGLLAAAQANKILGPGDPERMMEHFFALLWGDLLLSRLLGAPAPKPAEIEERARSATLTLLTLHAAAA